MDKKMTSVGFFLALMMMAGVVSAQSFDLTDAVTSDTRTFSVTQGSAWWTNGTSMVVFEGELSASVPVAKQLSPTTNLYVAAVKLLAQIRLFDDLPLSNDVGAVQGAVAAMKDSQEATTGTYYVWGITNNAPLAWVPLLKQSDGSPFTVSDGETNYLTFVFNYVSPVTYQVFVGQLGGPDGDASRAVTAYTSETAGINGVSLWGTGGLAEIASGMPGALSTSLGFSVYDTATGLFMVIDTVNETGSGLISVYAWVNGERRLVGQVMANGSRHYEFYALAGSGLVTGQSYRFEIEDESGYTHKYQDGITIGATKMESVTFEPNTMLVSFNTEPNHDYLVRVAESPAAPAEQWAAQFVKWSAESAWTDGPFTATATTTVVRIPVSSDKKRAFFKVFKLN